MALSESGERLRQMINLAIEDGHIDAQEQSLLRELQDMIESKMVKFSKD